ncbi:MAG: indolepyruvate oxidoreductase subunit beta [Bacillota bacterium]|nr:indolepyruvate oxidoreductase subunit beta [Bacillota bacterium]
MTATLKKDPLNIIICGVGGQGNILASELFASALVEKGYAVTIGETYGASQRGGSVMSHVRISSQTQYGPLIPVNQADIIIGFEPIETLRIAREFGNTSSQIVLDTRPNYPLAVLSGEASYPPIINLIKELSRLCKSVQIVEAAEIAINNGNPQAANITLMGTLTALEDVPLTRDEFISTLQKRFSGSICEMNQTVFELGYSSIQLV